MHRVLQVLSAGLPEGGSLALRAVRVQDHKCVQDATRQSAVRPAHVLHHHEPPQPGQWRLRPWSGWLCPRAGVCPHQGETADTLLHCAYSLLRYLQLFIELSWMNIAFIIKSILPKHTWIAIAAHHKDCCPITRVDIFYIFTYLWLESVWHCVSLFRRLMWAHPHISSPPGKPALPAVHRSVHQ